MVGLINQMYVDQSELFFMLLLFRPKEDNCFVEHYFEDGYPFLLCLQGDALCYYMPPFQGLKSY